MTQFSMLPAGTHETPMAEVQALLVGVVGPGFCIKRQSVIILASCDGFNSAYKCM